MNVVLCQGSPLIVLRCCSDLAMHFISDKAFLLVNTHCLVLSTAFNHPPCSCGRGEERRRGRETRRRRGRGRGDPLDLGGKDPWETSTFSGAASAQQYRRLTHLTLPPPLLALALVIHQCVEWFQF